METNVTDKLSSEPDLVGYLRVAQVTFLTLFFLTGIPGNTIICYLVYRSPRLRTVTMVTNLIIGNLAVADFAVCLLKIPVSLSAVIARRWVFDDHICNAVGFINSLLLFEVLYSLALVSISRYCCVVSPPKFSAIFTKKRTLVMIAATWLLSTLYAILPVFNWGSFHFEKGKATCVIKMSANLSYTIMLAIVQFIFPFLMITVPYSKIFRFLRTHNRRLSANDITSSFRRQSRTSLFHDFKMTKLLLIVVCFFVACWTPYAVVNLLAGFGILNHIPLILDLVCNLLTFLSSSCNPFIYGLLNNQFRKGFRDICSAPCQKCSKDRNMAYGRRRSTRVQSIRERRLTRNNTLKTYFLVTKASKQYETSV